jgi:hypothetical protein
MQGQDKGKIEFPLTLVSSLTSSKHNVISDFTTLFTKPYRLHGEWEVGITSIAYSNEINNITCEEDSTVRIEGHLINRSNSSREQNFSLTRQIDIGNYKTPYTLTAAITKQFKNLITVGGHQVSMSDLVEIKYEGSGNNLTLYITENNHWKIAMLQFHLSKQMCSILGLDPNTPHTDVLSETAMPQVTQYTFPRTVDMSGGVYMMYIKCDHIEDSHVAGGQTAPILRVVPLTSSTFRAKGYTERVFQDVQWRAVSSIEIPSITIKAHEDLGEHRIKFQHGTGPFLINLKFRKIA